MSSSWESVPAADCPAGVGIRTQQNWLGNLSMQYAPILAHTEIYRFRTRNATYTDISQLTQNDKIELYIRRKFV